MPNVRLNGPLDSSAEIEVETTLPPPVGGLDSDGSSRPRFKLDRGPPLWIPTAFAIAVVVLLVLPSQSFRLAGRGDSGIKPSSGGVNPTQSTVFPYLLNASVFPHPDRFFNGSGNATLAQIATSPFGTTAYDLLWAQAWTNRSTSLEYSVGSYNSSMAASLFYNGTCGTLPCPRNLPITWGPPAAIASFATNLIVGDALASRDSVVAAAATVGSKTYAYFGYDAGQLLPWVNLTKTGAVVGVSPKLAISPCGWYSGSTEMRAVLMTTIWAGKVTATTFPVTCVPTVNVTTGIQGGNPLISGPNITSLFPNNGTHGTVVTINGTGFGTGSPIPLVKFGGVQAGPVVWKSSSQVTAGAPLGGGAVPVQITVNGMISTPWPWTYFDYSKSVVSSVAPTTGPPQTLVTIHGLNLSQTSAVFFGSTRAASFTVYSSSLVTAVAPNPPPYTGVVDVRVVSGGTWSDQWPHDHFTFQLPPVISTQVGGAVGADPFWIPGPNLGYEGMLVADASTFQVSDYNSSNLGASFTKTTVGNFSPSLGSQVFTTLGSTRLVNVGGPTGQVTAAAENSSIFGGVTTESQGIIMLQTFSSENGGHNWSVPYLTQPVSGSLSDPQVVASPAGYYYVTWRENGAGNWQVDQAVFGETGRMILPPQVLPNSGGGSGYAAGSPAVAVDGLQRPVYAWSAPNLTGSELRIDGAFPSSLSLISTLSQALNLTTMADFNQSFGAPLSWKALIQADIVALRTAARPPVTPLTNCTAQTILIREIYPNVTANRVPTLFNSGRCPQSSLTPQPFMANLGGPFVANTYFLVYADWLAESMGWGVVREPSWAGSPDGPALSIFPPGGPNVGPVHPFDSVGQGVSPTFGDVVTVNPVTENPNSILFRTSTRFPNNFHHLGNGPAGISNSQYTNGCGYQFSAQTQYVYVQTVLTLTNHSGSSPPFQVTAKSSSGVPWIYVINLTAGAWGNWTESVNATAKFSEGYANTSGCPHPSWSYSSYSLPAGYPGNFSVTTSGSFLTALEVANATNNSKNVTVVIGPNNNNAEDDSIWFNSSIISSQYTALNFSSNGTVRNKTNTSGPAYRSQFNVTFRHVPVSTLYTYNLGIRLSTANGTPFSFNRSTDMLNSHWIGSHSSYSAPLAISWSCSFAELPNPILIGGNASNGILNVTATTANLTWVSNFSGAGWAAYHELRGNNFTASAQVTANTNSSTDVTYPYRYRVELHGLHSWGIYVVQVGVASTQGCVTFENWATWHLQTLTQVALGERDQPYDSVTRQGGGAVVQWQVPIGFLSYASFLNGSFVYWPSNQSIAGHSSVIPLTSLPPWIPNGPLFTPANASYTYGENLTALNASWNYSVAVFMNFTVNAPWGTYVFGAGSLPLQFWYLRSTTSDGLTDWEKTRGWEVTYQGPNGGWGNQWVTANPQNYSTNGLVGDFIEKEYGLNPRTVDSAGSNMLDGWNLTFDMGLNSSNPQVPATTHLRVWNELGQYNWSRSCQIFYVAGCPSGYSFSPFATGATNLTRAPYPASYNWSSEILFKGTNGGATRNELTDFLNASGVQNTTWLRAVLGTYNFTSTSRHRTLTVWGKLSWGANPLASSTPHDGVSDGSRVNPAHDVALDISLSKAAYMGCPGAGGGHYAWAVRFYLNYSTYNSGKTQLSNYTNQTNYTGMTCSSLANYALPMPINGTAANESLTVQLIVNEGTHLAPIWDRARVSGSAKAFFLNYSVLLSVRHSYKAIGATPGGGAGHANIFLNLTVVPVGTKAPTFLWQPSGKSTLSLSPWGLKRYTGEQAFDLIVIHAPQSVTSDPIPDPLNASNTTTISLGAGLTNWLVQRGQFLESPFGDAVTLATNLTDSSSSSPLLGLPSEHTLLQAYSGTDPLDSDICYWLNRATNNNATYSPIEHCQLAGTPITSNTSVVVSDLTAQVGSNAGGLPSNPTIENSAEAGAALQAVITLNISSRAEFDLLLAGLLDNRSSGVNGSFSNVTSEVGLMGLSATVTNGVANETLVSSGMFGYPAATGWAPVGPPLAYIVNNPTGVLLIAGALLEGGPMSLAIGISLYISLHAPLWLTNLQANLASRFVGGLRVAAAALVSSLNEFLALAKTLIIQLLTVVVTPINNAMRTFVSGLSAASNATVVDVQIHGSVLRAEAVAWVDSLTPAMLAAVALALALEVGLGLTLEFSLGATFLAGALIGLLLPFLLGAIPGLAGIASFSSSAVTTLEHSFSNSIPSVDWTALADVVGVGLPVGDFFLALMVISTLGGVSEPASIALLESVVMDMIIFPISAFSWALGNPILAIIALFFSLLSAYVSGKAWADSKNAILKPYLLVSTGFSLVGMAAAGYDATHA